MQGNSSTVLIYGSENWALNRSDRRETEIAEMCFLRHVSWYALTIMYEISQYDMHYKYMLQKKE
jgi:hypothetical protein